uniref:Uncharacterized protein n=1 Tax=Trypanosoma vivax (strain Y486) TaxID=1055687 RepID=G0UC83_TRYVY|nr:hypothetical protein TVY486_1109170 [Trypanosoma vivax Y486]
MVVVSVGTTRCACALDGRTDGSRATAHQPACLPIPFHPIMQYFVSTTTSRNVAHGSPIHPYSRQVSPFCVVPSLFAVLDDPYEWQDQVYLFYSPLHKPLFRLLTQYRCVRYTIASSPVVWEGWKVEVSETGHQPVRPHPGG